MIPMDPFSRLLATLAGMQLRDSELALLVRQLRRMPEDELVMAVRHAARILRSELRGFRASSGRKAVEASDIPARVERLLKHEANLSTQKAYALLCQKLVDTGVMRADEVPPLARKSFADWVSRLEARVPPKDILRFATIIRNQFVNHPGSDWALSEKSK